jgi:hypothetical protein
MPSFDINFTDGHDVVTRRVDCADPAVATEIAREEARRMMREAGARGWSRWQIEVLDAAASVAEIPASPIVIPFPDLDAEPG